MARAALLTATILTALVLAACSDVKNTARELTNDKCSASEIAARMQELGADQMDSIGAASADSMESVQRMTDDNNRFMSATARINAAIMRDDLDQACKLLDQLEADMGKSGS